MNRGALANVGVDAWTYGALEVRAVAAAGTPVDPRFDPAGDPIYNWVRYNVDLDRQVTAQYQVQTVGSFAEGSGADAWCFRLPTPARRMVAGARGEWPLGTAIAYRSFTSPFVNLACVPVLADPAWPQLRSDADSWFQLGVPYCWAVGETTIVDAGAGPESTSVTHELGYAPKAYDVQVVAQDRTAFGGGGPGFMTIQNIDTNSFDIFIQNVDAGTTMELSWKLMAEPQTGNPWLGPRKPFYWASSSTFNLFIQLRYEAA